MNNIKKYISYVLRALRRMRYFPWRISLLDICNKTLSIFNIYNQYLLRKMDEAILTFLKEEYESLIDRYINIPTPASGANSGGIIWTCWWQGVKDAPILVQKCIESIRRNAGNHSVIVITWDNLSQYIEIPEHILALAKKGDISLTHLSDVLRVNLLATHGGLWLDSTMFYISPMEEKLWNEPFFSPRAKTKWRNDGWPWCLCLLMAQREHVLFRLLSQFYHDFFRKYPIEIHYFMMDYMGLLVLDKLGIQNLSCVSGKEEQPYVIMLDPVLGQLAFDEFPQTYFFQLTYKRKWPEYTTKGKKTVYGILKGDE